MADEAGTGTTLYTAPDQDSFAPRFGEGSCSAHLADGAVELGAPASLRLDVDTPEHLDRARLQGLGPRTAEVVTSRLTPRR